MGKVKNRNKIYFRIIAIFLSLFLFVAFEGILRLSSYGKNLQLFIENKAAGYEDYMIVKFKNHCHTQI